MHAMASSEEKETGAREPLPWYAVYTKHQHERSASELLAGKGFEVFLPLYRAEHRWKDRRKVISLPIFPCYLFVQTGLERKLSILETPGVFWLVETGGRPCEVPDTEIDAIRKATQSSAKIEPHPYLQCGDRVRVREGSLNGIEGILARVKNRCRVVLSVHLLQKAIAVEVDYAAVERIGGSEEASCSPQRKDHMFDTVVGN